LLGSAGIGARASQFTMTINHCHSLAQCGRSRRTDYSGGAAADDDEIKFLWVFGEVIAHCRGGFH